MLLEADPPLHDRTRGLVNKIVSLRALKELRRNLREESETLQLWTKIVNIGLVPLLVALLGLGLALRSRNQQRAA